MSSNIDNCSTFNREHKWEDLYMFSCAEITKHALMMNISQAREV